MPPSKKTKISSAKNSPSTGLKKARQQYRAQTLRAFLADKYPQAKTSHSAMEQGYRAYAKDLQKRHWGKIKDTIYTRHMNLNEMALKKLNDFFDEKQRNINTAVHKSIGRLNQKLIDLGKQGKIKLNQLQSFVDKEAKRLENQLIAISEPIAAIYNIAARIPGTDTQKTNIKAKNVTRFNGLMDKFATVMSSLPKDPKIRNKFFKLLSFLAKNTGKLPPAHMNLVMKLSAKDFNKISPKTSVTIGFLVGAMSLEQRYQYIDQVASSAHNRRHTIELINTLAVLGLIPLQKAKSMVTKALKNKKLSGHLKPQQAKAILQKYASGEISRQRNKIEQAAAKLTKHFQQDGYMNPFDRMWGWPMVGMIGSVWGFLVALFNMIANKGKPNGLAALGVGAMLASNGLLKQYQKSYRRGVTTAGSKSIYSRMLLKEPSISAKLLKRRKIRQPFAKISNHTKLNQYFAQGGFQSLIGLKRSTQLSNQQINKMMVTNIKRRNISYDELVKYESKQTQPATRIARLNAALKTFPGKTLAIKKINFNAFLTNLLKSSQQLKVGSQKDFDFVMAKHIQQQSKPGIKRNRRWTRAQT